MCAMPPERQWLWAGGTDSRYMWFQVQLMCKYLDKDGAFKGITEVPDPYYGGAKGFELVSARPPDDLNTLQ